MRKILYSGRFKKDFKISKKRGKNLQKLHLIISLLVTEQPLPLRCRDHALTGDWIDRRECHIEPDWLLIYKLDGENLVLERTGTHTDLFD